MTIQLDVTRIGRTMEVEAKEYASREAKKADPEDYSVIYDKAYTERLEQLREDVQDELMSDIKAESLTVSNKTQDVIVHRYSVKDGASKKSAEACLHEYSNYISSEDFAFNPKESVVNEIISKCFDIKTMTFGEAERDGDSHRSPGEALQFAFSSDEEVFDTPEDPKVREPKVSGDLLKAQMDKKQVSEGDIADELQVSVQEVDVWLMSHVSLEKEEELIEYLKT